jgi:3-oxoacyl-[acyl-carrier protein] reductase
MSFENKRALVTGGSRGIGRAIVLDLASKGCKVVFTFFSPEGPARKVEEEAARKVEEEAASKGYGVWGILANAANFQDAEKSVNFAVEKLGGLDILVNSAGITKDNLLLRMSENEFDMVISVNLKSVFNYTKLAIKYMMNQRYGRIINISSVVGIIGNPGQSNYVASKAGVIGFTKSVAKEVSSRNITVNTVAPGFISTDMTSVLNDKQKEMILNIIPLKKIGTPENIAKAVAFLASDDAEYITGQVIAVDGGMSM